MPFSSGAYVEISPELHKVAEAADHDRRHKLLGKAVSVNKRVWALNYKLSGDVPSHCRILYNSLVDCRSRQESCGE